MATQLVRHMTTAAAQRTQENKDSDERWLITNRDFIKDLIYNTARRLKAPGVKRAELAEILHKKLYEETYDDVSTGEDKERKVRVFFEPLIELFKGDRRAALLEIKRSLDYYFPIPAHLNREWKPEWKTVPYAPKKKADKRTKRVTVQFNWSIKKAD